MIDLRDADIDISAGITRSEHAARTAYDADTLFLLRRARRALRTARQRCACVHPQGLRDWQPHSQPPDSEE